MLGPFILAGCVVSTLSMEGFIIGGQYADIKTYPHSVLAMIHCKESHESRYYTCGSSIVNQDILLSAAHCIYGCKRTSKIGLFAGSATIPSETTRSSYSFTVHRQYNPITFANDIMLIILDEPLEFNTNISRVALMAKPPYFELASVAGWGVVDEDINTPPKALKSVMQRVKSRSYCYRWFDMEKGTFCAAADNDEGAPARGDSGSALIVREYIQIGIVSYKMPTVSKSVIIYTDVGYFFEWIIENSKEMFCVS